MHGGFNDSQEFLEHNMTFDSNASPVERQTFLIARQKFTVDARYRPLKKLGSGAYGMVCSAMDNKANKKVAIKKIRDLFHNLTDAKRILREIKLLQHLEHPYVVKLIDLIDPECRDFTDFYLVMEHMQSDLHRIIYSDNDLTEDHIAYIVYQILVALKWVHSANVIHRDLKPGNILINADCNVKVCDFGLARGVNMNEDEDAALTEYVVTRWYRAPEVMVSSQNYGFAIDVWSVGCILAELYNQEPFFQGENYVDQLKVIFSVIGTPTDEDLDCIHNEEALNFVNKLTKRPPMKLKKLVPKASKEALDLLQNMLMFNPSKRISVDVALKHPFFAKFYNAEFIEKHCNHSIPFDFSFEKKANSKDELQDLMFEQVLNFRPWAPAQRDPPRGWFSRNFSFSSKGKRQNSSS